jgi:Zn-dependent protease
MPRAFGRLTLNPAKHLDPLGTIMLFLAGFGWAKPVEFRPSALSSKRFGAAIVALAGPLTNVLLATLAALALSLLSLDPGGRPFQAISIFFGLNLILAVFNLLPLPPLDGSRLLTIFLPPKHHNIIYFLDKYGFVILLALVFFGGLSFIQPIIRALSDFILTVTGY